VRTRNQIDVQLVAAIVDSFFVESHAHPSAVVELVGVSLCLLGVCPHQVAQQPVVRDVLGLLGLSYGFDGTYLLTNPAMHAQNFFVNKRAHGKVLKCLAEFLPYFDSVPVENSFAGVFEAVDLINKSALVVSSQHVDVLGIPYFVGEEQSYYFNVVRIAVYIISLEKVLFVRGRTYLVEEPEQVVQLSVGVPGDYYWRLHFDYYWFLL
jgi:hypothetical protein